MTGPTISDEELIGPRLLRTGRIHWRAAVLADPRDVGGMPAAAGASDHRHRHPSAPASRPTRRFGRGGRNRGAGECQRRLPGSSAAPARRGEPFRRVRGVPIRSDTLPGSGLLQMHLAATTGDFVFTSPLAMPLRRSDFDRLVFRPAVDGNPQKGTGPPGPGSPSTGCATVTRPGLSPMASPKSPKPGGWATTSPIGWSRPTATSPPKSNTALSADSNTAGNAPTASPDHPTTAPLFCR